MKQIIIDNISTSYYITEDGKCYNSNTGKFLQGTINAKNGYKYYKLTLPNGKQKSCLAHRLVAIAFIENVYNKAEVNHIDGNKLNNYVENLEWVTAQENISHALNNELKKFKHVFCFTKDKELVAEYKTIVAASKATNINRLIIASALDKTPKVLCGGFYWSYNRNLEETRQVKFTGKAKAVYQYDKNFKFITKYESAGQAGRALGCKNCNKISECCRGKIKTYKGFIFRYVEDIVSPSDESPRDCCEQS